MKTVLIVALLLFALWFIRIAWQVFTMDDLPLCNAMNGEHFWLQGEPRCRCKALPWVSPWHIR